MQCVYHINYKHTQRCETYLSNSVYRSVNYCQHVYRIIKFDRIIIRLFTRFIGQISYSGEFVWLTIEQIGLNRNGGRS